MNQPSYQSFNEFQAFAFHKQLRFILKLLRRVKEERDHRYLSSWDTTSQVVEEVVLNEMLPAQSRQAVEPHRHPDTDYKQYQLEISSMNEQY